MGKKKRILVITTWFPNVAEPAKCIFVKKIIEAQYANFHYDISIISPLPFFPFLNFDVFPKKYRRYRDIQYFEKTKEYKIYRPNYWKLPGSLSIRYDWYAYFQAVLKTIKRENIDFDLIHSHGLFPDSYVASLISQKFKKPLFMHLHDSFIQNIYKNHFIRVNKTLNTASKILAVSNFQKQSLLDMIPFSLEKKVEIVYNGIHLSSFSIDDITPADTSVFRLLFVGSEFKNKGLNQLLLALAFLKNKLPIQLDIVGQDPHQKDFESLSKDLGIVDLVSFKGMVENQLLLSSMTKYAALILPSSYETFGIVLIEAMASGIPVISTRICAIPEIVSNDEVGILVSESFRPEELAKAIYALYNKKWDKDSIRRHAKYFAISETAKKIDTIYDSILLE